MKLKHMENISSVTALDLINEYNKVLAEKDVLEIHINKVKDLITKKEFAIGNSIRIKLLEYGCKTDDLKVSVNIRNTINVHANVIIEYKKYVFDYVFQEIDIYCPMSISASAKLSDVNNISNIIKEVLTSEGLL